MANYSISAVWSPVATSATDIFEILNPALQTGERNTQVSIKSIQVTFSATAAANGTILLIRRLVADTSGTSTIIAPVCWDSQDQAKRGSAKAYTANPTLGTSGGQLAAQKIYLANATLVTPIELVDTIETQNLKNLGIVINPGESLAINLNSGSFAGISCGITVILDDLHT